MKIQSILFALLLVGAASFAVPAHADTINTGSNFLSTFQGPVFSTMETFWTVGSHDGSPMSRMGKFAAIDPGPSNGGNDAAPVPTPEPESLLLFLGGCLSLLAYAGVRRIHNFRNRQAN